VIDRSDIDIDAEWRAAARGADWPALSWLLSKDVPAPALVSLELLAFSVGTLAVRFGQGFWTPHAAGQRAYVIPANENAEHVEDLVAWRPKSPATFWRRTGSVALLGESAIYDAIDMYAPLHLFASPFEWLRHGREGFVILDWEARLPSAIDQVSEFLVDDMDLARRLQAALERPRRIPPIRVHRKAVAGLAHKEATAA
jgi:hypothetical protein